jgi:hypothetical protein
MMATSELLDPTSERLPARRERASRPASLEGVMVGLLDIAKARGDVFLNRLEELLNERGLRIERFRKPTFTRVLPPALAGEIAARAGVVVEALAD